MKLEFRGKGGKVLGAGDWWVEHEKSGSTCCTGLWENGEVIALLVGHGEKADTDYLKEKGDAIVRAVNSHDALVEALKIANKFCGSLTSDECPDSVHIPIRKALDLAGKKP